MNLCYLRLEKMLILSFDTFPYYIFVTENFCATIFTAGHSYPYQVQLVLGWVGIGGG